MGLPEVKIGWIYTAFNLFIGLGTYFGLKKKNIGKNAVQEAEDARMRKFARRRLRVHGKRLRKLEDSHLDMGNKINSIDSRSQDTNHQVRNMAESLNQVLGEIRGKERQR